MEILEANLRKEGAPKMEILEADLRKEGAPKRFWGGGYLCLLWECLETEAGYEFVAIEHKWVAGM